MLQEQHEQGRKAGLVKEQQRVILSRTHRVLIGVVVAGAAVIAGIGFTGSYAAVRALAEKKGFGAFSVVFPIGIDAGIVVLLALDLLLTWIRIPFPLLRQTAWLLTAATIAFNGAAAWPDALGVGMHAVIPVLFVVAVEAARHAVGRIADITADRHMEGVRIARWLLSPIPTFLLWRRMKLWELRSYDEVIQLEQERLVYQTQLRARYGRGWRRRAPVNSLMPLQLARYGVPLAQTAPAGLAAAGIDEPLQFFTALQAEETPMVIAPAGRAHQEDGDGDAVESVGEASLPPQMASPTPADQAVAHAGSEEATDASPVAPSATPSQLAAAYEDYVRRYGSSPNSRQFSVFVADVYGIVDPATGGPLTEAELRPVVQELRRSRSAGEMTDPSVTASVDDSTVTDWTGHATRSDQFPVMAEPSPAVMTDSPAEPELAPTASAADSPLGIGHLPQQAARDGVARSATSGSAGQAQVWDASVKETGEATARLPEPPVDVPVSELTEEQRIERVVEWLLDAEASGKRLSGAEAGRRNEVSPKTGQRDVIKAKAILAERQREQGRAHLRSVRSS
ncbi:DUF2637 domain-containing protein [Streptomyces sp. N2A]|uniref:DUF2637 domain-containing protein n=1 Tax=Streptomyces sp. N2A TaxID=3073936 RepID=UPI00287071CF|nr:DUF2637 domain-containing protein [Streptomyces sp. N2A]